MYTIKRAAEATGVPEATLRAWERRYAVVAPQRTAAGYRLYDEQTIADLITMQSLVRAGWAPSQAAAELTRRREAGETPTPQDTPEPTQTLDPEQGIPAIVDAAARMDAVTVGRILDQAFSRGSLETVIVSWLLPALEALGTAWEVGEVSVAGEHMTSHAVQRRLAAAYEAAGESMGGPRVVVGLPRGARHDLGALCFAAVARRRGADVVYLGTDLPEREWVEAVRQHDAQIAVVVAPLREDADAAQDTLNELWVNCRDVRTYVGGGAQDLVGERDQRLGHDVVSAARSLIRIT